MKTTKHITRTTPTVPVVPPAPTMASSLAIVTERLLFLADGAAAEAASAVKAGCVEDAQHRLDQAASALSLARRAGADTEERVATLSTLRIVVEEIGRISS